MRADKLDTYRVGGAGLILYLLTLQQGVSLPDSTIIMDAMRRPVISAFACNHSMNNFIGWIVCTLVPLGTTVWKCNAVSALYGAACVALFHAWTIRLGATRALAFLCAASLMVSHGLWWHSTLVENYALSALLLLLCAHLLLDDPHAVTSPRKRLFLLFFLSTLAVFNHLQNGLFPLACAGALMGRTGKPWRMSGWLVIAGLGGLAGAIPYCSALMRDLWTGQLNHSNLLSWLIGGGGFEQAMLHYASWTCLIDLFRLFLWNFTWPFAIAVMAGMCLTFTANPPGPGRCHRFAWCIFLGNTLFFIGYSTWDRFSFFLVPWTATALMAASGLTHIEQRLSSSGRRALLSLLAIGILCSPFFYDYHVRRLHQGHPNWMTATYLPLVAEYEGRYDLAGMLLDPMRRDKGGIEHFIRLVLRELPKDAVWIDDCSTFYQIQWLQQQEGLRPDIHLLMIENAFMPGYGEDFQTLAMRCQWRMQNARIFLVSRTGLSEKLFMALKPFGWQLERFPLDANHWVHEVRRSGTQSLQPR